MYAKRGELILHDGNRGQWFTPVVEGEKKTHGLIPRNYETHPVGFYGTIPAYHAVQMPDISEQEVTDRLKALREAKGCLSDIRLRGNRGKPIPSRDQNGKGYCWAHSGVSCHLIVRALFGLPYVDLSAYAIACQIKNFRDEGGWGPQGIDWQIKNGVPTSATWPQQSMDRANVNDRMKQESSLHRITDGWIDLAAAQYDRNLTWSQIRMCAALGWPWTSDHNWWSHSVGGLDVVDGVSLFNATVRTEAGKKAKIQEFEQIWDMNDSVTGGEGSRIWNSWGDEWSERGMGILPPAKAVPDGSVAVRVVTPLAA
jgi:hypothetical protein